MKSNCDVLGNYIRLVDYRNDNEITDKVFGISIDKEFMPSVANIIGTDLSKYKLIKKGIFACNPMHVGRDDQLPIALYKQEDTAIVSPAYFTFEIIDNTILNDEYLMAWFRRSEFDRICWFMTDGSVRGGIAWTDLCRIPFSVPSYDKQLKIVESYKIITNRIAVNDAINKNLEQQAIAIYQNMFKYPDPNWARGTLSDIATITMGQSPTGDTYNVEKDGMIFFQGRAEFGVRFPTIRLYTTEPKRIAMKNDVLLSVRAPVGDLNVAYEDCCIGRGLSAIHSKDNHQSFVFYTMLLMKRQLDVFNEEGTVFGSINRDALNSMPVCIPSKNAMDEFEKTVAPMDAMISDNHGEICTLQQIRDNLLPKLMSGELNVSNIAI